MFIGLSVAPVVISYIGQLCACSKVLNVPYHAIAEYDRIAHEMQVARVPFGPVDLININQLMIIIVLRTL